MAVVIEIKLKHLLDQRGMTQKELSELTGIRPAAISSLARGYIERLNINHLERICDALDISNMNELLCIHVTKVANPKPLPKAEPVENLFNEKAKK